MVMFFLVKELISARKIINNYPQWLVIYKTCLNLWSSALYNRHYDKIVSVLREDNSSETTQLCVESTLRVGVKWQVIGFGWNCWRSPERRNQNTFIIIHKAIKERCKQRGEEKPCKSLLQCLHTHMHLLKHITISHAFKHIHKVTQG